MRVFIVALALLAAPAFAAPQLSSAKLLRSLHLDPGFRQDLRERDYTGERFEIMDEHTRLLFSDTAKISGLESKIGALLERHNYKARPVLGLALDSMMGRAFEDGLARLTSSERLRLFAVDSGFFRAIPARDCNKILNGRVSGERGQKLNDAYMVQLSPAQLRSYHAAIRMAMRQGLTPSRKAQTLSAAEVRAVEEQIFPALDRLIGAQKHADKLYAAWSNPSKAGRYACSFNQFFSAAAMNLKGATRDRAILYLMTNE